MAAQMVVEGRMRASIDQIEGVIRFEAGMRFRAHVLQLDIGRK
jgi:hypothetical protein